MVELLLFFIILIAWLFTPRIIMSVTILISFLTAVGYSVYRLSSRKIVCEKCGQASLIPLDTPVGQKLLKETTSSDSGTENKL